ncbi:MAG: DeoR/GlpR family DNA-binding transcription regulator, partial [bacterium]
SKILEIINERKSITVQELSEILGVCEVTIRKDLNRLDEMGLVKRTHGGAIAITNVQFEPSLNQRECENLDIKVKIGRLAVGLIEDRETIILDSGTTTYQIAKNLKNKSFSELTVITNSIAIANELINCINLNLIVLGGECRAITGALVGSFTEEMLKSIYADKVFLGANGFSLERGLTAPNPTEAHTKMLMARSAKRRIGVIDHTKIGLEFLVSFCSLSDLNVLITDDGVSSLYLEKIRESGTEVLLA